MAEDKVIIEVKNFTPRSGIAKATGKPYTLYELEDGRSGRKAKTFDGDWVKNWQNGDMVEVIWGESSEYNGVTTWVIKNPNAAPKKPWGGRSGGSYGGGANNTVHSFYIAATLLAPKFDKKIDVDLVAELAAKVQAKLEAAAPAPKAEAPAAAPAPAPAAQPAPTPAPAPTPVQSTDDLAVTEEEDEDKPF